MEMDYSFSARKECLHSINIKKDQHYFPPSHSWTWKEAIDNDWNLNWLSCEQIPWTFVRVGWHPANWPSAHNQTRVMNILDGLAWSVSDWAIERLACWSYNWLPGSEETKWLPCLPRLTRGDGALLLIHPILTKGKHSYFLYKPWYREGLSDAARHALYLVTRPVLTVF